MLQNISFTLSEGIEKIKTEKIRKKIRKKERGFRMEWFNSILAIPAPSSAHCKERLYLRKPTKEELGYASFHSSLRR